MAEADYQRPQLDLLGAEHVAVYRETGGEVGYEWNGVATLLLTTTGRRSLEPRTSPLIFAQDGDDYLVVASTGGAPNHPAWYLNLEADPTVEVQVKADVFPAVARTATGNDRARLWSIVTANWPNYDVYQSRTDRIIPIVVLRRS